MLIRKCIFCCAILLSIIHFGMIAFSNEIIPTSEVHKIDYNECEVVEGEITDSYGNVYDGNIVRFDAKANGYASFDLDGNYEKLEGAFLTSTDTANDAIINAAIFVDGIKRFSISNYTRQSPKEEFEIDLYGASRLDIKTSIDGFSWGFGWLFLANAKFYKVDTQESFSRWNKLCDTVLIDSKNYNESNTLSKDSFGELHNGALQFDATLNGYALFNLNKQYHSFKASISAGENTSRDMKMNIDIYCDNELVISEQEITKQDPKIDIEFDVTDVSVLRVETSAEYNGDYGGLIYLYDDILIMGEENIGEVCDPQIKLLDSYFEAVNSLDPEAVLDLAGPYVKNNAYYLSKYDYFANELGFSVGLTNQSYLFDEKSEIWLSYLRRLGYEGTRDETIAAFENEKYGDGDTLFRKFKASYELIETKDAEECTKFEYHQGIKIIEVKNLEEEVLKMRELDHVDDICVVKMHIYWEYNGLPYGYDKSICNMPGAPEELSYMESWIESLDNTDYYMVIYEVDNHWYLLSDKIRPWNMTWRVEM